MRDRGLPLSCLPLCSRPGPEPEPVLPSQTSPDCQPVWHLDSQKDFGGEPFRRFALPQRWYNLLLAQVFEKTLRFRIVSVVIVLDDVL